MSEEEKKAIEESIEKKYVEVVDFKENLTLTECCYILDDRNKYSSEVKAIALLKIIQLIEKYDKMIDLMAYELKSLSNYLEIDGRYTDFTELNKIEIKEHFRKEVENEK